ncbi:aldolase/citrate lyase family protein [Aurantimonas sp. MSK8Z-1]|uniref:HpcH/HpaI aldolase family protein n=1 Tax=Mangrovibrevibacter kandeliae TaxID=2968473 RepID=UPI00211742B3|nr:aldolase/citrate lyase family protein [Aurantimonas sp. MSK8Z-1]MCW4114443.1 aldolase/citrate lyase family protein [Aurantimonas sp. MSK8Z-1]
MNETSTTGFGLRAAFADDGFVLCAWSLTKDPVTAEAMLRAGFDAITFDMQHGLHDVASMEAGIARAVMLGRPALVRVPVGDLATAARALDFGGCGVIMPMIGNAEDARQLAAAVKYPPVGQRSCGPMRAMQLHGVASSADYIARANRETMAFAMIETASALGELDAILSIEALDGVFVGPSDLSIALSPTATLGPTAPETDAAIRRIGEASMAAGKVAAIYCITPEDAQRYRSYGYRLCCLSSDAAFLQSAAAAQARAARG